LGATTNGLLSEKKKFLLHQGELELPIGELAEPWRSVDSKETDQAGSGGGYELPKGSNICASSLIGHMLSVGLNVFATA
jgi:hypothetical protein